MNQTAEFRVTIKTPAIELKEIDLKVDLPESFQPVKGKLAWRGNVPLHSEQIVINAAIKAVKTGSWVINVTCHIDPATHGGFGGTISGPVYALISETSAEWRLNGAYPAPGSTTLPPGQAEAEPVTGPAVTAVPSTSSPFQKVVDSMKSLTAGRKIPELFGASNSSSPVVRSAADFNANEYFSVLDRLSMEPGYGLDYIYSKDSLGAQPYLYARKETDTPFETLTELTKSIINQDYSRTKEEQNKILYSYLDHVQTDGTPEGYFQFVALRIMGPEFYLWWHANYNDRTIVCSPGAVDKILSSYQPAEDEDKSNLRKQMTPIDFEPRIEFQDDTVIVKVVIFTKWGGLIQESYTISGKFPHSVLSSGTNTLVKYEWGLRM